MRFRIRPDKPFTDQIHKVAGKQLRLAVSLLEQRPDGLHEAIHDARRCFKRLRALYRLVRTEAKDFQKQENARLRDIGQSLSATRDATSLIEACDYLGNYAGADKEEKALARVSVALTARRDRIASGDADIEERIAAAISGCHDAQRAMDNLVFDDDPSVAAAIVSGGWSKTATHARTALEECRKDSGPEVFHTLRKRSQDYWMYTQLLADIWPTAMGAKQAEAKHLIDVLGHNNDLFLLLDVANAEPDLFSKGKDRGLLFDAIMARQKQLRANAVEDADVVFADDPEVEGRIIGKLWVLAAG
ncbi:CHAD domain-containing protein [Rhizobiaceae bacterium n13]|uniref:CHAD domain-containing protein n=1 Tax=Ferirhizobium litorale TaxID=2927786 RepID=A0AAE3QB50_9HYPH|nr:CHAD domain-containing protein [Fererhizobium litorale]MDI7860445.1 CHAD domain-containing protein [Fererhizobium litorale]MDI7920580.1 CHAD domain-containing protein [Fererhizobium litorale]